MLGAIIGDIAGSRWEFNPTNDYNFELFSDKNSFTDDTICTIAIADAILKGRDYGESLHDWCRRYMKPHGGFGGRFRKWVESDDPKPYNSYGNGSAMRVSPVGMWFKWKDVDKQAKLSAACTHNHPYGIKGAQCIASAISTAIDIGDGLKSEKQKHDMILDMCVTCANDYGFASNIDLEDYKNRFDETCQGTIPPALEILYDAESFEDAIRKAVSLGADADTLAAIVGSVAEHLWGIPEWMKAKAMEYLTPEMRIVVEEFYEACEKHDDYRPETKKMKEQEAVMLWKLGAGHMGKYLNGENPMPAKDKPAKRNDWEVEDMPDDGVSEITMGFSLKEEDMAMLRLGHIPEAQEDHWFMYCDEKYIRYYRSWTGMCAFEARYYYTDREYRIDSLKINQRLSEFGVNGDVPGECLFLYLIYSDCRGVSHQCWDAYVDSWEKQVVINMEKAEEAEKIYEKNMQAVTTVDELERKSIYEFYDNKSRLTPEKVDCLESHEVFVFGSNTQGHHDGGASKAALKKFGAIYGQGDGMQGQSYAISTTDGLIALAKNINRFVAFAKNHPERLFLVTPIGCGNAGYNPLQVAPLFRKALVLPNICMPRIFMEYYWMTGERDMYGFKPSKEWGKWSH